MSKKASLQINGELFDLPIVQGTEQEQAINISSLRGSTGGLITIDPGFKNTGSCQSGITFLDGEKGILRYRGYSIEELANKADFLEVAFLFPMNLLRSSTRPWRCGARSRRPRRRGGRRPRSGRACARGTPG
mgnify:CR=1 FL=1